MFRPPIPRSGDHPRLGQELSLRILAVWTRALDDVDRVGRINVACQVRDALAGCGRVRNELQRNILESGPTVAACLAAAKALLVGLATGRPLPLQCALFASPPDRRRICAAAAAADVVYADGIRTLLLLRRVRRRFPGLRIVVDLDDLMSERYAQLAARRLPLAFGYVDRLVPRPLARLAAARPVARLVLAYEHAALRRAEGELLRLADEVVLLNEVEAQRLARFAAFGRRRVRAGIRAIPPPVRAAVEAGAAGGGHGRGQSAGRREAEAMAWRAIFVGSDALPQNRLTIDYLIELWQGRSIRTPLVIYGRQRRRLVPVANIQSRGYVSDILEAYAVGSILICPTFLGGGIKTKVLEAFAFGVPVVGNAATFEGLRLHNYPLCIDDEAELVALLQEPAAWAQVFARARDVARECLARDHVTEVFQDRWQAVMAGGRAGTGIALAVRSAG